MSLTYCTKKPAYIFSIKEHLHHVLNNLGLMKKMHFNYGIEARVKSELWHGETWHKSPLYSNTNIIIRDGIYLEFSAYLSRFLITFISLEIDSTIFYSSIYFRRLGHIQFQRSRRHYYWTCRKNRSYYSVWNLGWTTRKRAQTFETIIC